MNPQTSIAHYRITSKLGEGGMGAVYRATDTKLNRDVAVKVLTDSFAQDTDRLARFAREAQVLASLNHPNIAAIYGVEERALVMELVEGETLKGPLTLEQALPIIHQLIDALEYAHEKGIIHRDLKPANIKITPEGRVKVLDFGLAKAMSGDVALSDPAASPTLTMRATMAGVIMGTAGYMAPEQARGHTVDKRADIWAFGVVVYEMLTGRMLFEGPTVSDTLAAVLTREPDLTAAPAQARRLLQLCLTRDARQRLHDISGARVALDQPTAEAPARTAGLYRWTAAALAVVAFLALGALWRATRPVDRLLLRLSVDLGPDAVFGPGVTAAISPDGARIAFSVRGADGFQLASRRLDQAKATILGGTNGIFPFFSPDGQWIGFFADGKLKKISVNGGAAIPLCDASIARGGTWGEDGTIIASLDSRRLSRVAEAGGTPQTVSTPEQADETHRWPQLLPGGQAVLFTINNLNAPDFENANIAVLSLKTGTMKILQRGGYFGRYLNSGHLTYVHQGTLFGVPFDASRLETRGTPQPLIEDVAGNAAWGGGNLDFSQTGIFVYLSGKFDLVRPLVSMDSTSSITPLGTVTGLTPRLSPDGKLLALSVKGDIVVYDARSDATSRITFNQAGFNLAPVWTPDGKHIVYAPSAGGIWWTRADGSGQPQQILAIPGSAVTGSFSPDGRRLAYHQAGSTTNRDIWILPLDVADPEHPKPGKPELFLATPGADLDPAFSPDGRWLAYATNESGNYQVYVRASSGSGMWQISTAPGRFPVWSRNGREVFFLSANGYIMVVEYTAQGGTFAAGKPRQWSDRPIWMTGNLSSFDLAPDGKHFVAAPAPATDTSAHVTFLINFFDELRRRMP